MEQAVLNYIDELEEMIEYFTRLDYVEPIVRGEIQQKFKDIYWNKLPHLNTIKQALLKTQEPKHYLKWEDLEFDTKEQTMKVILNGSIHLLCYYRNIFGSVCIIDNTGITIWEENKKFFNDLHLEVKE